jgi:hypothetical protein
MNMNIGTSLGVLEFLTHEQSFQRTRYEVHSGAFSRLRRSVRGIILALKESNDEWIDEQLLRLQRQLAQWLTTPGSFQGDAADELIDLLGEVERLCSRWGKEVLGLVDAAMSAASIMARSETALQAQTRHVISSLLNQGCDFRILCHRTGREHFHRCLPESGERLLLEGRFLHSARDYRQSPPFDVLVKVGPLRTEGWGASPSSILSAPRFRELQQIVWHPTADDPGFGVDPVLSAIEEPPQDASPRLEVELPGAIRWTTRPIPSGDSPEDEPPDEADGADDLGLLSTVGREDSLPTRKAVLLIVEGGRGVLYPPGASVLIFDPAATGERRFEERQAGDEVERGTFLVWPRIREDDSPDFSGAEARLLEVWRSRLSAELSRDPEGLARRLRAAGLNLAHPEAAARNWSRAPTTVIHAPKQKRHFNLLMKVLGIPKVEGRAQIWHLAWQEVCRSRGEAIQAGMQEHARLIERCISVLRAREDLSAQVQPEVSEFVIELSNEGGLYGTVHFLRIEGVEDGYRAPDAELRQMHDLDEAVRWRV